MALQQVKIDNTGTYGGYDPDTSQGFAASDQATFEKFFPGQTPDTNAPLASFDTSSVLGTNANKLLPVKAVYTSADARSAVNDAAGTLTQGQQNLGGNPVTSRVNQQISDLVNNLKAAGGSLSPQEQEMLNRLTAFNNNELSALATGQTALGTGDYKGAVSSADSFNQTQKERADLLKNALNTLSTRQADIDLISRLFESTPEEQQTSAQVRSKTSQLRDFDVNTMKGEFAIEDQDIPKAIVGRQQLQLQRQRTFERLGLSNELLALTEVLADQTASRSMKLQAAQFMFNAKSQSLADSLAIYRELAPQNVANHVDEQTGEMTVIMRNPLTGETVKENLGRVGTPKTWTVNADFARAKGIAKPWYRKIGSPTVYNTQTGMPYSTWEQFLADGGQPDQIEETSADIFSKENVFGSGEAGFYYLTPDGQVKQIAAPVVKPTDLLGNLTPAQRSELNRIQDNVRVDPDVKDFVTIRDGFERVQTGANLDNAQGDLALLFGYMKILDPTSVVRETEFANAEEAQGTLQQWMNIPDKFMKGTRLTPEGREHFAAAAREMYDIKKQSHERAVSFYGNQLDTFGIPRELGLRNFTSTFDTPPAAPAGQAVPMNVNLNQLMQVPNVRDAVNEMRKKGISDDVIKGSLEQHLNGPRKVGYLSTLGPITAYGSSLWKPGLDIDLKKGDPVKAPFTGKVLASKTNGGFGLQVKIKLDDGREAWLSHLDKSFVKTGDTVRAGQTIALGGNSGNTIPMGGGDGSHLDFTMKDAKGKYLTAAQVKNILQNTYV